MITTIKILTKQLQLLEIELGTYMIAKNQGDPIEMPEEYYAGLAHAVKGLQFSIQALEKNIQ